MLLLCRSCYTLHSGLVLTPRSLQNTSDPSLWQTMAHVKASILQRFDTAPSSIRICCVKFIERVVQCQTPGLTADPRVRWSTFPTSPRDCCRRCYRVALTCRVMLSSEAGLEGRVHLPCPARPSVHCPFHARGRGPRLPRSAPELPRQCPKVGTAPGTAPVTRPAAADSTHDK